MTTAPSKRTVTDKLCDQAERKVMRRLETDYEKVFPHTPAGDSLWPRLTKLQEKITVRLAERPISKAEINGVVEKAGKLSRALLKEESKKVVQPRYRECTHIDTGAVRLIPDYD